jgi:hypothetical protein
MKSSKIGSLFFKDFYEILKLLRDKTRTPCLGRNLTMKRLKKARSYWGVAIELSAFYLRNNLLQSFSINLLTGR